jgi:polyferredoxin
MNTNTTPVRKATTKTALNSNKAAKWARLIALFVILAYVTYEAYMHQILGGGKAPSVHALCPFGALESLYSLLFTGNFIQKIFSGTLVLFVLTVVLALLFRRSFCGVLCPFGALQELFARIGKKLFKKRLVIPAAIDKPLRYLKYVILGLTVVMAWIFGSLWMAPYDPYSAYGHITAVAASIAEDPAAIVGFALLAITIIGSLLYDRFFCKYLCPMGGLYAIIGKLSPTKVVRNKDVCINCSLCTKACSMNIDVAKADKVTHAECINCNECVVACPKKGALETKFAGKKIHPLASLALVLVIFFGVVLIAQAAGFYNVLPNKQEKGSKMAFSDVMGYNTIEETAKATGLSVEDVYKILGIPDTVPADTMMKNISKIVPGYDFDAAKEAAEKVGGGQITSPTASPKPAGTDSASKAQAVDVSGIKGSMTIMEAATELKMDVKEFYKLFKIKDTIPAQTAMKDISMLDPSYDFHAVKTSLQ